MRTAAVSALGFMLCALSFQVQAQQAAPPAKAPAADVPICANCHEQAHASTALTAHGAKNDASGSMCQTCHGDASAHLKDPVKNKPENRIKHGTFAEKTAVCMTCHAGSRHLAFWEAGRHARNEVSCANCHSIHGRHPEPRVAPYTTSVRDIEAERFQTQIDFRVHEWTGMHEEDVHEAPPHC